MGGMKDMLGDKPPPWTLDKARAERDAGMAQAFDHAERDEPDWGDIAYSFLVTFAHRHREFISEDVSDATKETEFPQPPTDRAWGAVYLRASKRGIIEKVGIGRSRRRHASICPLWRSRIYRGATP